MSNDPGLEQGFRLGEILIDPLHRAVHGPAGDHELSEEAAALLLHLAESPGQAIEGRVLRTHLGWPDSADLAALLSELQAALGDDPGRPRYVRQVEPDAYELMTDVLIDVPPVPTTEDIVTSRRFVQN